MPLPSLPLRLWLPRLLWALALAGCAAVVWRTEFRADFSAFLPREPSPEQRILVAQLQDGAAARVLLLGLQGAPAPTLAALGRQLAERLRADALLQQVHNGQAGGYAADEALLLDARYLLSPQVGPERFSAAGLRQALQQGLAELGSSTGLLTRALLARDPTGELLALLELLLPADGPPVRHGHWFNAAGDRALLLVQTRAAGSDLQAQQTVIDHIQTAFEQSRAALAASDAQALQAQLLLSGPAVFAVTAQQTIRAQAERLALAGALLVIGLLYTVYRSFTVLALGLLPVASGALAGVAAVSLGFGHVHGLTLGFGTTLIGEAVDYAIYLFVQRHPGADPQASLHRFWPTVRLGVLTSVCGFAALLFSGFNGLAQLGLYSLAGLAAAALVTRWVLPGLLPAGLTVRDLAPLGRRLQRPVALLRRLRTPLLLLALAAAALLAQRHDRLWNHALTALSPVPAAAQALDAQLRADMAAPDVRHLLVVQAPDEESALQRCEALLGVLDAWVQRGELAGYLAPCRYLPSQATQHARQQALPDAATLQARLAQALQGLPLRPDFLAPFVADVQAARTRAPLTAADLQGSSLAAALDATLTRSDGQVQALIQLRAPASGPQAHTIDAARLRTALAAQLQDGSTVLLDLKDASETLYAQYLRQALRLSALGVLGIVLLLAWQLRSARRVLAVCLPLAAAVLLVMAGLHLAGVRLNLLHLVGLLLVVAVGSNYALFFDSAARDPEPAVLASLLLANLTTVAGFGLLATADVPVLQALGQTVGPGAVAALLLAAAFSRPAPADAQAPTITP